jgi:hypothetical protein
MLSLVNLIYMFFSLVKSGFLWPSLCDTFGHLPWVAAPPTRVSLGSAVAWPITPFSEVIIYPLLPVLQA